MSSTFVHLHTHSEFSMQQGLATVDGLIQTAVQHHMPALALTDIHNGFAWLKFYQAAIKKGIKPILGAQIQVKQGAHIQHMLLLMRNVQGYIALSRLLSHIWRDQTPYLNAEYLYADMGISQNLLAILLPQSAILQQHGQNKNLNKEYQHLAQTFGDALYIGLSYLGQQDALILDASLDFAHQYDRPVVATHPIEFLQEDDFQPHEVKVCIAASELLHDPKRVRRFDTQQYFFSPEQMIQRFSAIPGAIEHTLEIAKRCNVELRLGKPQLPAFPTPEHVSLEDYLRAQSEEGLKLRLQALYPQTPLHAQMDVHSAYFERLDFELNTIIGMGFAGYFLIVADFINWAKTHDVPVGPGRGSGAGSLVAYVLNITDLDPLRYGLLFERFLNPERVSMPDFDIDFCQLGRDRVIQYVKQKYGSQAVSQIATFGTMAAKAAIRDVGRVLQSGYNFVDGIAKLVPFKPGKLVTIASALEEEPQLKQRYNDEEDVQQLLDLAQKLEGLSRNVGMHAGGVLIAPGELTDFCPLYSQDGQTFVSQYDKDDVETIGLVKFDFLGLTTLTILEKAQKHVQHQQTLDANSEHVKTAQPFDYRTLDLIDIPTFDLLKKGNTVAVFQLESKGMQSMIKDAKPDCFEDIIALVSLYRPGPMDLIPDYIARKHGRQAIVYPDERVASILKETYGIMVYQEQVMQMAQIIGGYTLGGADLLRRAMGKKKAEEMAEHREIFWQGAQKNGLSRQKSDEIFDLMEKFAGYGFNKSHAAAYALLAYHTAWFKAHYPCCFMAANLSMAMDDTDKIASLIKDCQAQGIQILPPDITQSAAEFTPNESQKSIRYGLAAIKGVGGAALAVEQVRQKTPFTSLADFLQSCQAHLNKRSLEAFIKAGCLDIFVPNRAQLFDNIDVLTQWAQQSSQSAQTSLFTHDDAGSDAHLPPLKAQNPWAVHDALLAEKAVLGFFLSAHLFTAYQKELAPFKGLLVESITILLNKDIKGAVHTAALITQMRTQITARGKMVILQLDDGHDTLEAVLFSQTYDTYKHLLKVDHCLIFKGELKFDAFLQVKRLNVQQVFSIEQFRIEKTKTITFDYQKNTLPWADFLTIHPMAQTQTEVGAKVLIRYHTPQASVFLRAPFKAIINDIYLKNVEHAGLNYTLHL